MGGSYHNGSLGNDGTHGMWWGSEVTDINTVTRRYLRYYDGKIGTAGNYREFGFSIRCINKQKTVLDLTYMQEMTPEIASADFVMRNLLPVLSEYFDEPKKIFKILENCHVRTVKTAVRHVQFSLINFKNLPGAKSTIHEKQVKDSLKVKAIKNLILLSSHPFTRNR